MKKILLMALALSALSASYGSADGQIKNTVPGNVIYTSAPREIAFRAACQALQNLGYKIETKDAEKCSVKGSYSNPWAGHTPLYAQIDVSQETSGTKISYSIDQPGAIKILDITGRYSRCGRKISKEIEKILAQDDVIAYRKNKRAQKEHKDKHHGPDDE